MMVRLIYERQIRHFNMYREQLVYEEEIEEAKYEVVKGSNWRTKNRWG